MKWSITALKFICPPYYSVGMQEMAKCNECGTEMNINGCVAGEIVDCQICGLNYVVTPDESGALSLKEMEIEGEDWGE